MNFEDLLNDDDWAPIELYDMWYDILLDLGIPRDKIDNLCIDLANKYEVRLRTTHGIRTG